MPQLLQVLQVHVPDEDRTRGDAAVARAVGAKTFDTNLRMLGAAMKPSSFVG